MRRSWHRRPAFVAAVVTLGLSAAGIGAALDFFDVHLRKLPIYPRDGRATSSITIETEHWVREGVDRREAPEVEVTLGTTNYLTRTYRNKASSGRGELVELHLAYYTGMIDTVPHVPERCFTGGGFSQVGGPWVVPMKFDTSRWVESPDVPEDLRGRVWRFYLPMSPPGAGPWTSGTPGGRVNLPRDLTPTRPMALRVSEFRTPDDRPYFSGYVFIANGGWVSSAEGVRLLAFNLRNRHAYYLKIQVNSVGVRSAEELAEVAGRLLSDLLGDIMLCVPDWVEVERGTWPVEGAERRG